MGRIRIESGKPLQFDPPVGDAAPPESPAWQQLSLIAKSIKTYVIESERLMRDAHVNLSHMVPGHLRTHCNIFVLQCDDAVFVRYDQGSERTVVRGAVVEGSLVDLAPQFSDGVVRFGSGRPTPNTAITGPKIELGVIDEHGVWTPHASFHPVVVASPALCEDYQQEPPPAKPPLLLSMSSVLELRVFGEIGPDDNATRSESDVEKFLAVSKLQLPVGWLAVEVFPIVDSGYWQVDHAKMWAKVDILACAAKYNADQDHLNRIDGRQEVRRRYAKLLSQFEQLLAGHEEPVHQFLRRTPQLLCPTHVRRWSKLAFGDRVSDFVFLEPPDNYILVELEAPIRKLFRKDGQQREELTHAINQILDWKLFIRDNREAVEIQCGLKGISATPRSMIVIGRSQDLGDDDRRKLSMIQDQFDIRVLTYDDLLLMARANIERLCGPLDLESSEAKVYFYRDDGTSIGLSNTSV